MLTALIAFGSASATEKDSLIRWQDLKFESPFEREAYFDFLHSKTNFLKLFLANAPDADRYAKLFSEKIDDTIKEIEASGMLTKKNNKKIKYIYDLVHQKFFVKYEAENRFYEIIKNGKYNCVSSSALFAIVFERLKIPYKIVELPTHVYLVAYPDVDNIRLETTAPIFGFSTYSTEFKLRFVNELKKQKIVAADDATQTEELFNKHFFGSGSVSLIELAGIHYLNDGLYYQDNKDQSAKSHQQFAKGYLLWPSERAEYLFLLTCIDRLNDSRLDATSRAEIIGMVARSGTTLFTTENIVAEFHRLTTQVLDKENDRAAYKKYYDMIMANVTDPDMKNELAYYYNYENGRVYYNQGNFARAKPYFKNAFSLRPRSADIGATFLSCLANTLKNERRPRAMVDTLLAYKTQFPILEDYPNFLSMLAASYAAHFGDSFENGDATTGEKAREQFEQLIAKDDLNIAYDIAGRAYSEAAAYYFRKGQKTKAKALIDKGLQIAPDNYELKARKQMLN